MNNPKTYRVFPDYGATGVWGEIGDDPYVIELVDLLEMGASTETIFLLRKMQYVFEETVAADEDRAPEEAAYLNWAMKTIAKRLTKETGFEFRSVS